MNTTARTIKKNCPKCNGTLVDKGLRSRELMSICGPITINRNYYRCPHCQISFYPDDTRLNISRSMTSKGFAKICSQLLLFMPFEHAAQLLKEVYRCEVSETFLKELSDKIGSKLYKEAEYKSRMPYNLDSSKDEINTIYIHADGAMVPILGDESIEYKENKLGLVYTDKDIVRKTSKKGKTRVTINNKRYVSSIGEGVDPFKKMMYANVLANGYRRATNKIFLTDGAAWLKKMKDEYFPEAIHILDWYHAVDHLWITAKKMFGEDNYDTCLEWVNPKKELLWKGCVKRVIRELTQEGMKSKKYQTALFELRGYFVSNEPAMQYDSFRDQGFFIGSGAIESANKYIVADRLKRTGMRWTLQHANSIIWLKCKYFEDQWNEFWDNMNISEYLDHNYIIHKKGA